MDFFALALLMIVGVMGGFLNTVAGGGSALTMPMLIFLGLPSTVANGTARVAIMFQNITAVASFKGKGHFEPVLSLQLGIPALLGALVGSRIAIQLPDSVFNTVLSGVMVLVLISIFFKPNRIVAEPDTSHSGLTRERRFGIMAIFFVIGVYGGFIQAGVGFLIMSSLIFLSSYNLVRINAIKVSVILVFTVAALIVFLLNGKVAWGPGLILALGNAAGAWLGARFSVAGGESWIRVFLVVAVLVMAVRVSGLLELLGIV